MTNDSCTSRDDLAIRRHLKKQQDAWNSLAQAVAALKDSERHLLKAYVAMDDAKWSPKNLEKMQKWAASCEEAANGSHHFLLLVGGVLGHSDPFSTGDSG